MLPARRQPAAKRALGSLPRIALALALSVVLAACGGGGDAPPAVAQTDPPQASTPAPGALDVVAADETGPGALHGATPLGTVSTQAIAQAMTDSRLPAIVPVYDVETFRLSYMTSDGQGQPILASGLLAVPKKAIGAPSPVISYQHATIFRDAEAPSNNPTAGEPSVVMASMGYIVVAADYVGYGVSKGAPHPYLLSAPTAAAVVDLLHAARTHAGRNGLMPNGQLFLVGYSEGGYATAAAHRALQEAGGDIAGALVGSAPGGGPLDVGATLDELLRRVRHENALLGFLVDPDLLQNLGASLRRQVRDELLKKLLPGDTDVVFQTTFIDNFLANDRAAINRDSDVHDWRPAAPVRLFHGRDDQTVPFVASEHARQAMQDRGAPDVLLEECTAVPAGHLQCVPQYWQYMLSQLALVVRDL
jgi:pimeloyl-ACP methyl ester carboxylesterase